MKLIANPSRMIRAFSLIELLISLAIIAVLAAFLISAVAGGRQKVLSTRCLQNLKQTGVALFAYAADHRNQIPPRSLGLYRDPKKGEAIPTAEERPWVNRLVMNGYVQNPDILYCPAFTPFNNQRSPNPLPSEGPCRTYGLRTWTPPGTPGWGKVKEQEEHKPLSAIEEPADFFLVTDTVWLHSSYRSQGYGINPGMGAEQVIHLRHSGMANALFADGHVEAKPESYFAELHLPNRQRKYSGGKSLPFGVVREVDFK